MPREVPASVRDFKLGMMAIPVIPALRQVWDRKTSCSRLV